MKKNSWSRHQSAACILSLIVVVNLYAADEENTKLKVKRFGFDLQGAVMASDAYFPFPDCVEIADKAGITAVIQPGGSVNDHLSVEYCNAHKMKMVRTGVRHFKH